MSDKSGIEWTDATWNPVTGCTEVSPGCDHCYAKTFAERFRGVPGHHFEQGFDVQLRPEKLELPLHWVKPRRVFVNSMSDLFHEAIPDAYIADVFAVMAVARQHTFQVLTKRHGRMRSLLSSEKWVDLFGQALAARDPWPEGLRVDTGVLPNVWLGVSVENQKWADIRIPALLGTPAAVRFLSCEPLLGPVTFRWAKWAPLVNASHLDGLKGIGWVIAGGESGRGARPMHPDWARSLRDQCVAAGLPFLFKQWGEWRYAQEFDSRDVELAFIAEHGTNELHPKVSAYSVALDGTHWNDAPPRAGCSTMQRAGKKAAGRILDGRTWDEFPQAVTV